MTPAGKYWGFIQKDGVATQNARSTGTPQLVIPVRLTHRANNADWVDLEDGPIDCSLYMSLTDRAWPYTEKKLKALEFGGNFADPVFGADVISKGIGLTCRHETYQGTARERWELSDWGSAAEATGSEAVRTLNARWKATAGAKANPGPAAPPAATEDKTEDGEDIPF